MVRVFFLLLQCSLLVSVLVLLFVGEVVMNQQWAEWKRRAINRRGQSLGLKRQDEGLGWKVDIQNDRSRLPSPLPSVFVKW